MSKEITTPCRTTKFLAFFSFLFLFCLPALTFGQAAVGTDKSDYTPGETLFISGTGWMPGETVKIDITCTHVPGTTLYATADAIGNFAGVPYAITEAHLNEICTVTATGQSSAQTAQASFTDGIAVGSLCNTTSACTGVTPLTPLNNSKYKLVVGTTVTSKIINATDASTTTSSPCSSASPGVKVIIKSTDLGNTEVCGSLSGSTITFTFTAPSNGCKTTIVAYNSNSNNSNSTVVKAANGGSGAGTEAAGYAYVNASTDTAAISTCAACVAPTVTTNPANQTVCAPAAATFTAAASGTAPSVQWQVKVPGGSFTDIAGATSTTLTVAPTSLSLSGNQYRAKFTNTCGMATSAAATLTVNTPPSITAQPVSVSQVCIGSSVSFSVTATGTAPISYQWEKNGVNIAGATGSSFTIPSVAAGDVGTYSVIVSNVCGSVLSSGANLSIDSIPPVITQPANITKCNDPGLCSAVVAITAPAVTDNCAVASLVGTRSDSLALTAPFPKGSTTITWVATDTAGNTSTATQTVTVNDCEKPVIAQPANITKCNDPGLCSAVIAITAPAVTDNCDTGLVATGTRSDSLALTAAFPKGTTTITWNATDSSGNTAIPKTQTVTVNDCEPPKFTNCSGALKICVPPGTTSIPSTDPTIKAWLDSFSSCASDNCPGVVVTNNAPASIPVQCAATVVTFTATDTSGNTATLMANINATPQPVVTISPANGGFLQGNSTSFTASVSGGCGTLSYSWSITGPAAVSFTNGSATTVLASGFPAAGAYTVSVTVTDSKGCTGSNSTSATVVNVAANGFMRDTNCNDIPNGFDVVFSPDGTTGTYKIPATNPGGFMYNLKLTNNTGAATTFSATITIPNSASLGGRAFALWGAVPVHVYINGPCPQDGTSTDITSSATIVVNTATGTLSQPLGGPSTLANSVTVSGIPAAIGQTVDIQIHMRSRLIGTTGYPATAQTTFFESYDFSASLTVGTLSINEPILTSFVGSGKKVTGVGGNLTDINSVAKSGVTVSLYSGSWCSGTALSTATSDTTGFYKFLALAPGSYSVGISATAPTTCKNATVVLDVYTEVDFADLQ
ncbi:MAG: HYR domain-containing protein [Acidobacteria bacterium]|nr:HYR domain-containing protein [Acidobacteriota bacterium]